MKIGVSISTLGGSPLVDGLMRGCRSLGHTAEWYSAGKGFDLVLVFNQCAHDTSYQYANLPGGVPIAFIDSAEYGYFKRLPEVAHQYQNTFSAGALAHDTKNRDQQLKLKQFLEGRSFPYFIREYLDFLSWPEGYHPIDYPLYYASAAPLGNREEYLRRPKSIFVCWGGNHPWRFPLTELMRMVDGSDITIVGGHRIPQDECFEKTSQAKCSVTFDGYGSGSFRMMEVLCRTLLIRGKNAMRRHRDLVDGETCLEFVVRPQGEHYGGSNILEKIREALADPERSWSIHEAGYHHCMANYTEMETARYVLETIERHDWNKPTLLDL